MSKRITNGQKTSIHSLIAQTHNSNKIFSPIKFAELKNDCWGFIGLSCICVGTIHWYIFLKDNLIIISYQSFKKPQSVNT